MQASDFGNFLVHPLLTVASLPSGVFAFERTCCAIDPTRGSVHFSGLWHGQRAIVEARQLAPFGQVAVEVYDAQGLSAASADALARELTHYFNTVVLDMDGTQIQFADFNIRNGGSGGRGSSAVVPLVQVTVDILVTRVPDPRSLQF